MAGGLYPALFAVISSVCGFLVGAPVFGVDFTGVNLGLATLTTLCAMASASCFGLFLSVFGLMNNSMHLVLNVVSYLLMVFYRRGLCIAGAVHVRLCGTLRQAQRTI